MTAKVATWLMDAEEKGIINGYVPERARLKIVKTEDTGERIEMSDVTLTW